MSPRRNKSTKGPRLIVVSAPSGAGKTTLCELLMRDFADRIGLSVSMTTRPKRPYETDGLHYHFVTELDFRKRIDHGEFAEWATVHEHLYGTPKSEIEKRLKEGKHILFPIDVQGAKSLKALYPTNVLLIFIEPPSLNALEQRLISRQGDSRQSIETRLQNAYNELQWSKSFDYQVINDDLNRAYQELKEIVTQECL